MEGRLCCCSNDCLSFLTLYHLYHSPILPKEALFQLQLSTVCVCSSPSCCQTASQGLLTTAGQHCCHYTAVTKLLSRAGAVSPISCSSLSCFSLSSPGHRPPPPPLPPPVRSLLAAAEQCRRRVPHRWERAKHRQQSSLLPALTRTLSSWDSCILFNWSPPATWGLNPRGGSFVRPS